MFKYLILRDETTLSTWLVAVTSQKDFSACILKDRVICQSPFTIYPYNQAKEIITFFPKRREPLIEWRSVWLVPEDRKLQFRLSENLKVTGDASDGRCYCQTISQYAKPLRAFQVPFKVRR